MVKQFLICVMIATITIGHAHSEDRTLLKNRIQAALESNVLTPFDISFETYVNLGLWDELTNLIQANTDTARTYTFPGIYYSRPYVMKNTLWIFENQPDSPRGPQVIDLNSMKKSQVDINETFHHYEGGIRTIHDQTIISGASDKNVDITVLWDTEKNTVKTLRLEQGHYVASIYINNEKIYVGSCGGFVNVWGIKDLNFDGVYSVNDSETLTWNQFNNRECIVGVYVLNDFLYGAGERSIFIWNLKTKSFVKSYPKAMGNSTAQFFKEYIIESIDNYLTVSRIEDGMILKEIKLDNPIDDVVVTSEKLLSNYSGDLLIASMRLNRGIVFYQFPNLTLIKKLDGNGINLCVTKKGLFATDDRHLYYYQLLHHDPDRFNDFVKNIHIPALQLTDENFYHLVSLARLYPNLINFSELTQHYMKTKQIDFEMSIKYGKINKDQIPNASINSDSSIGYKASYKLTNLSNGYVFISMAGEGKGQYGIKESPNDSNETDIITFYRKSFFMTPNDRSFLDTFGVGDKEPRYLYLYPTRICAVSQPYYEGFITALSAENKNLDIVDTYLNDEMVIDWREDLEQRKNQLVQEKGKIYRLIRKIRDALTRPTN